MSLLSMYRSFLTPSSIAMRTIAGRYRSGAFSYHTSTAYMHTDDVDQAKESRSSGESVGIGEKVNQFVAWLGGYYSRKAVLTRSSNRMYESCIESLEVKEFYKAMDLPDSFQSWFLVTQLHIWLCLVRLKREGEEGDFLIRELVARFWEETRQRMNNVGVRSTRIASQNMIEYQHAFNGLLIAYEEGLVFDDMILASAVWRNWCQDKTDMDPVQLAKMVKYIREQVKHMDGLDSNQILDVGSLKLLPFQNNT